MIRFRAPFHRPWLAILVLSMVATAAGQAPAVQPTPSVAQRAAIERGEPVQILEALAASPWPRSIVYQFIDATPEECAAVLTDYELQAKYIPRMKTARIVHRDSAVTDVEYVIDVPVYPDERSVSRHRVTVDTGRYRVLWQTKPGSSASVTTGSATFAPMINSRTGKRGTLLIHDQSVVPSSAFAKVPFVRNKAIEASRDAATAIARQIESERTGNAELLRRQVGLLRGTVSVSRDSGRVGLLR